MNSAETNSLELTELFRATYGPTLSFKLKPLPEPIWLHLVAPTIPPKQEKYKHCKHIHVCGWSLWSYVTLLWSTTGWNGGVRMSRRVQLWLVIHEGVWGEAWGTCKLSAGCCQPTKNLGNKNLAGGTGRRLNFCFFSRTASILALKRTVEAARQVWLGKEHIRQVLHKAEEVKLRGSFAQHKCSRFRFMLPRAPCQIPLARMICVRPSGENSVCDQLTLRPARRASVALRVPAGGSDRFHPGQILRWTGRCLCQ